MARIARAHITLWRCKNARACNNNALRAAHISLWRARMLLLLLYMARRITLTCARSRARRATVAFRCVSFRVRRHSCRGSPLNACCASGGARARKTFTLRGGIIAHSLTLLYGIFARRNASISIRRAWNVTVTDVFVWLLRR